mgnify:CR=1 FL=1
MKDTLIKAAKEAGNIIKDNFGGRFGFESKENVTANIVTEIDKRAEARAIEIIKNEFPDHGILAEEIGGIDEKAGIRWIIDPIDGTTNFAHGLPICCVSIGIEKEGEIIMGAVYNPILDEFFFAEKGDGAYLNDKKISVSNTENFQLSLLVTGFPYDTSRDPDNPLGVFGEIVMMDVPVRRLGSAAIDLCWIACGRFDGFWEYNLNPWDVAAGYLIVKEAGGKITDFSNNELSIYKRQILATNGKIHDTLLEAIRKGASRINS